MTQSNLPDGSHPITLQQKQTLIDVYQQTGNMTLAMRRAGIRSPRTAYLWWHRFCEAGKDALQPRSHARKTQKRLPNSIVEQICQLRCQEPHWGRRRIADELTWYYGVQVASPASVEAVLRRAGLWEQAAQPVAAPRSAGIPPWLSGGFDYDCLLETVQTGIRLSVHSAAGKASQILYQQVWGPLEDHPDLRNRLLTTPEIGSWLLSSRLHLGHSLMNSGHWSQAEQCLREMIAWMQEQEHAVRTHRRPWEDAPNFVSLRRDDVWLGCYHHLGLVLGKQVVEEGVAYLQTALSRCSKLWSRWPDGYLFLGQRGPLAERGIREIIAKLGRAAKLPSSFGPHDLRHTFAKALLDPAAYGLDRSPMPLPAIQQLLGHADIATTTIYTRVSADDLARMMGTSESL